MGAGAGAGLANTNGPRQKAGGVVGDEMGLGKTLQVGVGVGGRGRG